MGKDPNPDPDPAQNRWAQAYDRLAQLAPPLTFAKMAAIATVDGLRQNVPETVAQAHRRRVLPHERFARH